MLSDCAQKNFSRLAAAALAMAPLLAATPAAAQRATPVVNTVKRIPISCFLFDIYGVNTVAPSCARADLPTGLDGSGVNNFTVPTGYTAVMTDIVADPTNPADGSAPFNTIITVVVSDANGSPSARLFRTYDGSYRASSPSMLFYVPSNGTFRIRNYNNDTTTRRINIYLNGYLVKNEEVGL